MTDAEKYEIIHKLIDVRADMCEHTIRTASLFKENVSDTSSYLEMYDGKIIAATAVSSFCYELLEIMATLNKE